MFGLSGAWCPVELHAHSTHWFPFTRHGQHQDWDGHQTKERTRGAMARGESGWKHRHRLHQKKGVSFFQAHVHSACPFSIFFMSWSPVPHSIFLPFPHFEKQTQKPGSRQNTTYTTSTRVTNSTIGWILTTWDFLKTINYYLSFWQDNTSIVLYQKLHL